MKNILISGATGLLGSRLLVELRKNYDVWILTSKDSIAADLNIEPERVFNWRNLENGQLPMDDIDVIIHSSGLNSTDSSANPKLSYEVNLMNTQKLIDLCEKSSKKKAFIYFSTIHVYSDFLISSYQEDSPTLNFHPYASSHRAAENSILFANSRKKINGVVLRLSNAFGHPVIPETNCWGLLVNDLCRQAIVNQSLKLKSNGKQRRVYFSISWFIELVKQIILADFESFNGILMNVGSERKLSGIEIAESINFQVKRLFNINLDIEVNLEDLTKTNFDFSLDLGKLKKIYSTQDNFFESEIVELLKFCNEKFKIRT
jgi:UDP-glucose 4-epimerase